MVSKSYRNSCCSVTIGDGRVYSFSTNAEVQAFERGVEWRRSHHGVHVTSISASSVSWVLVGNYLRTNRPYRECVEGLNKSTADAFFKGCKTKVNRSL